MKVITLFIGLLSLQFFFVHPAAGQEPQPAVAQASHLGTRQKSQPPVTQKSLRDSLENIAKDARGTVGVSLLYKSTDRRISLHGNEHFPMQSVFKFPLTLYILHEVDNGKLTLDQKIHIDQKDWPAKIWSPLRDSLKGQAAIVPLRTLLQYTVSKSDNGGCDVLFKLAGGTRVVNDYIHQIGIKDIAIVATEAEMAKAWDVQYGNWCTPVAMTSLLELFMNGKILKPATTKTLMQLMINTTTGPARIKGLLPPGTPVAHKTGTSNTNDKGITAATNDAGIITLPDGKPLIITVFVKDAAADEATREKVIARIAVAAYK
ncbi:MAG TPA: class A beta-lactamase, subclass A2 [Puia sp.]|nr:class A beta-lactamase, subclass A2 [Puia sp.]